MNKIVLFLIRIYQRYLSFDNGLLRFISSGQACRYTPTCSEYTYQAVEAYGTIKGIYLGTKRILKCNPLFKGGFDPLIKKK